MGPKRVIAAAITMALALGAAGCGSDDETPAEPTPAAPGAAGAEGAEEVRVTATDFRFNPADMTAKAGEVKIVVANRGKAPHALEIEDADGEPATDTISPGQSGELTATLDAGEYEVYCPVGDHEARGMVGTLTVEGGDDAGGSGSGTESGEDDSGGSLGY